MSKIKILVTGACGVTSRSVVRSLRMGTIFPGESCEFIGTDIASNVYGIYEGLYSKVYRVPYANDPAYRGAMQKVIDENEIEYAIIIPEPEVLYWCEHPFGVKFLNIPRDFANTVISKERLYEELQGTGLVPEFQILGREELVSSPECVKLGYPLWIRDCSVGATSGKGSMMAQDHDDIRAWVHINRGIDVFMLSEYLPGRNVGCFLLFNEGRPVKYGVVLRITYFMGSVAVSGVTGNASRAKLINDTDKIFDVSSRAIENIAKKTGETISGFLCADLKEDAEGNPKITEINIRPTAMISSLASAGLNIPEHHMLLLAGREKDIPEGLTVRFPDDNIILRDIDGGPIYLEHYRDLKIGESR